MCEHKGSTNWTQKQGENRGFKLRMGRRVGLDMGEEMGLNMTEIHVCMHICVYVCIYMQCILVIYSVTHIHMYI